MTPESATPVKRRRPWRPGPLIPPPLALDALITHALAGCDQCRETVAGLAKDAAQMAVDEGPEVAS